MQARAELLFRVHTAFTYTLEIVIVELLSSKVAVYIQCVQNANTLSFHPIRHLCLFGIILEAFPKTCFDHQNLIKAFLRYRVSENRPGNLRLPTEAVPGLEEKIYILYILPSLYIFKLNKKIYSDFLLLCLCVYVGQMEWEPGRVQSGGGVSRDALHHQQRRSHLSQRSSGQRDTGPGLYNCKLNISSIIIHGSLWLLVKASKH